MTDTPMSALPEDDGKLDIQFLCALADALEPERPDRANYLRVAATRIETLSREIERLTAVAKVARRFPRETTRGGAACTVHYFGIPAHLIWSLDRALTEAGIHDTPEPSALVPITPPLGAPDVEPIEPVSMIDLSSEARRIRAETLEEAAKVADKYRGWIGYDTGAAIRSLTTGSAAGQETNNV